MKRWNPSAQEILWMQTGIHKIPRVGFSVSDKIDISSELSTIDSISGAIGVISSISGISIPNVDDIKAKIKNALSTGDIAPISSILSIISKASNAANIAVIAGVDGANDVASALSNVSSALSQIIGKVDNATGSKSSMEGLPSLPSSNKASDWNDYFAKLAERTAAIVKKRDDDLERDYDKYADYLKYIPIYGPAAQLVAKYFYSFGRSLAGVIYGKPDWNDPKYTNHALEQIKNITNHGWGGFPPFVGPDRATTEDAIDWASNTDKVVLFLHQFDLRHPAQVKKIYEAFTWADNALHKSKDRRMVDLSHSVIPFLGGTTNLWPIPLIHNSPCLYAPTISALARVLAYANKKDPEWMVSQAFGIYDTMFNLESDMKDETGVFYKRYDKATGCMNIQIEVPGERWPRSAGCDSERGFGDFVSRLVDSLLVAPQEIGRTYKMTSLGREGLSGLDSISRLALIDNSEKSVQDHIDDMKSRGASKDAIAKLESFLTKSKQETKVEEQKVEKEKNSRVLLGSIGSVALWLAGAPALAVAAPAVIGFWLASRIKTT